LGGGDAEVEGDGEVDIEVVVGVEADVEVEVARDVEDGGDGVATTLGARAISAPPPHAATTPINPTSARFIRDSFLADNAGRGKLCSSPTRPHPLVFLAFLRAACIY
jgi:hypothetical protein